MNKNFVLTDFSFIFVSVFVDLVKIFKRKNNKKNESDIKILCFCYKNHSKTSFHRFFSYKKIHPFDFCYKKFFIRSTFAIKIFEFKFFYKKSFI